MACLPSPCRYATKDCRDTPVTDLSPLKEMPLTAIACPFKAERDAAILRSITTLKNINGMLAPEFWKKVGKNP
jgi:hypothetical protein